MPHPNSEDTGRTDWDRHKAVIASLPRLAVVLGAASLVLLAAHLLVLKLGGGGSGVAEAIGLMLVIAESIAVYLCARALKTDLPQPRPIVVTLALTTAAAGAGTAVALGGFAGPFPFGLMPVLFAWPLLVPDRAREAAVPVVGGLVVHLGILALNVNPAANGVLGSAMLLILGAALSLTTAEVMSTLRRRVEELDSVDEVTHTLTENGLREKLQEVTTRRLRTTAPYSVALLDIDRFKNINDTYGRTVGDKVLEMLAAAVMAEIRKTDYVGRRKADEFIVVLDECDSENAKGLVERVRARVNQATAVRGGPVRVTFSAGIASARSGEKLAADQILASAEGALETSKEMARNCTSIAPPPLPSSAQRSSNSAIAAMLPALQQLEAASDVETDGQSAPSTPPRSEPVTELIEIPAELPVLSLPIPSVPETPVPEREDVN